MRAQAFGSGALRNIIFAGIGWIREFKWLHWLIRTGEPNLAMINYVEK